MSEIAEAIQVVEVPFTVLEHVVTLVFKTTEIGVQIVKALMNHNRETAKNNLRGEVKLDDLTRYEGRDLAVVRFKDRSIDEVKPVLEEYGIPYVVMPDNEINGVKYCSVTFGASYRDRMNAVLQHFGGEGDIINDKTVAPYIMSGEVGLKTLMEQDGVGLMAFQFPESEKVQIVDMLEKSGIKYAFLPDINLGDGMMEIAYPPKQSSLMDAIIERFKNSHNITFEDYESNADPKVVKEKADEYDRHENYEELLKAKTYEKMNELHLTLGEPVAPIDVKATEKDIDKVIDEIMTKYPPNAQMDVKEMLAVRRRIKEALEARQKELELVIKAGEKVVEKDKQLIASV